MSIDLSNRPMSLSSLYLDAFFAVAKHKTFSAAAKAMHMTQSALSQRVLNLEAELETALFVRERTGVQLTEAGAELLRYCRNKDLLEEEFLSRFRSQGQFSGTIRIGGFSSVTRSVILPALSPLLSKNPGIKLHLINRELRELPPLLKNSQIDFMVLDHRMEREDLKAVLLGHERNVLVASQGDPAPEIYLDHDEEDETTINYLKLSGEKAGKLNRRYMDDVYGILDGVRLGLGKAVLPIHLVRGSRDIQVINSERTLSIPVVLHFYSQPYYSKLHQAVVQALEEGCSRILGKA